MAIELEQLRQLIVPLVRKTNSDLDYYENSINDFDVRNIRNYRHIY